MRESEIEKKVCAYAIKNGFYCRKFTAPGRRGVPDRVLISPKGVVFFIEFKSQNGKLSDLQKREIKIIESKNAHVYVVDSVEFGKKIIDICNDI